MLDYVTMTLYLGYQSTAEDQRLKIVSKIKIFLKEIRKNVYVSAHVSHSEFFWAVAVLNFLAKFIIFCYLNSIEKEISFWLGYSNKIISNLFILLVDREHWHKSQLLRKTSQLKIFIVSSL